jgi:hypothetical protein
VLFSFEGDGKSPVFGFAFWDRKLSLAQIKKENLRTLNLLREFAAHQPKLREILKDAGVL